MSMLEGSFVAQPLFARSVRDLGSHNQSRPGVLRDVLVFLNNGDILAGAIVSFDPLGPDTFSFKTAANEVQECVFGQAPEHVASVTCRGKTTVNAEAFHLPKQSLEVLGSGEPSRRFPT